MTIDEHIEYWVKTADHDLATAESLFKSEHFDWCLYIGHLVLEKILKAHYVKQHKATPPKIHDLIRLVQNLEIDFTNEQLLFLDKVKDFHIEARYPDDKLKFYNLCTKDFTEINFNMIKDLHLWLKSILK